MKTDHELVRWLETRDGPVVIHPPMVEGGWGWAVEEYVTGGTIFHRGDSLRGVISNAIEYREDATCK